MAKTFFDIFMSDPFFVEPVTLDPNGTPVIINAMVVRKSAGTINVRSKQGMSQSSIYDVEIHVSIKDLPQVVQGKTSFSLYKRIGDAQVTVMTVGAIIYNDSEHFHLGLI